MIYAGDYCLVQTRYSLILKPKGSGFKKKPDEVSIISSGTYTALVQSAPFVVTTYERPWGGGFDGDLFVGKCVLDITK